MKDTKTLRQLIELFFQINPQPSDEQFHALACSVAVDHEALEAIAYEMLGARIDNKPMPKPAPAQHMASGDPTPLSHDQEILDGEVPPSATSYDRVTLNDSAPGTRADEHAKDDLLNDGVPAGSDAGTEGQKDAEMNDGLVIGAATRLMHKGL